MEIAYGKIQLAGVYAFSRHSEIMYFAPDAQYNVCKLRLDKMRMHAQQSR